MSSYTRDIYTLFSRVQNFLQPLSMAASLYLYYTQSLIKE